MKMLILNLNEVICLLTIIFLSSAELHAQTTLGIQTTQAQKDQIICLRKKVVKLSEELNNLEEVMEQTLYKLDQLKEGNNAYLRNWRYESNYNYLEQLKNEHVQKQLKIKEYEDQLGSLTSGARL